jgi:hypothetical protein
VVHGHTMSQEQFSKYRPCSCHAMATPGALGLLIGSQHVPPADSGQRRSRPSPWARAPA